MKRRPGRLRSATRGHVPGFSFLPLSIGVIADQLEGAFLQVRSAVRHPRPDAFAPAKAGYPTVVPIAGIFERWDHLLPLLRHLNGIGFGVHPIPFLGRNLARVDELAELVRADLDRNGLRDVAIVAHSKGGLAGKIALLRDGDVGRVRHLVALATPFKGSRLATLARRAELADFGPASRQTVQLSVHTEVDHRITSIFSTFDEVVGVPNQVALGTNIEAVRIGHYAILSSREVAGHVTLELSRVYGLPRWLEPDDESLWRRLSGRKRDILRDYGFAIGWQLRSVRPDRRLLADWQRGVPGKPAVVLLPGVLERWHFMITIGRRLHRAGYPVHAVHSLGINRRGAPKQAKLVGAFLAERGLRDVIVVAHSKGGLIGKLAMLDADFGDRIRGMVAVSTPFNGSPYAELFVDPSIREFSPRHPVIRGLAVELEVNAHIVSIWPTFDQHIPTSSRLQGAHSNILIPGTGHFRTLSSASIVDEVEWNVAEIASAAWPSRVGRVAASGE